MIHYACIFDTIEYLSFAVITEQDKKLLLKETVFLQIIYIQTV